MKTLNYFFIACGVTGLLSCNQDAPGEPAKTTEAATVDVNSGQSGVVDKESAQNIVQVASGSKDHTTLVAAVKAAELVDVLSNAGPFTVFAPINAAFDKLPAGTVEGLLKPEKKDALQDILQYHVFVGVLQADALEDGQELGMVNGGKVKITKKDGKIMINGTATIIASIPTSNGVIHVIDAVLLPK
jgi:uncharacterized surface protein with fasciclin (FAS1) repeats